MTMAPTTAIRAPGIRLSIFLAPRITTSTPTETASVALLVSPMFWSVPPELLDSVPPGAAGDAEHAADLAHRDLDADAGEEADQHAARQEVGQEPEPDEPGEDQHDAGRPAPRRRPSATYCGRAGGGQAGQPGGQDGGGGRVGADDEVPGRPEQREHGDRDEDRVEPGDHRHPGDLGVAHHLRDPQRGQRHAGHQVGGQPTAVQRQDPLQDREGAPGRRAVGGRVGVGVSHGAPRRSRSGRTPP